MEEECIRALETVTRHNDYLLAVKGGKFASKEELKEAYRHLHDHDGVCSFCCSTLRGANEQVKELLEKTRQ